MSKQFLKLLHVSLDTVRKKAKENGFETSGRYSENQAIITNVPKNLMDTLQTTVDVAVDYAKGIIIMMRNSQIELPFAECGYSYNVIVTFNGGQLMAVARQQNTI